MYRIPLIPDLDNKAVWNDMTLIVRTNQLFGYYYNQDWSLGETNDSCVKHITDSLEKEYNEIHTYMSLVTQLHILMSDYKSMYRLELEIIEEELSLTGGFSEENIRPIMSKISKSSSNLEREIPRTWNKIQHYASRTDSTYVAVMHETLINPLLFHLMTQVEIYKIKHIKILQIASQAVLNSKCDNMFKYVWSKLREEGYLQPHQDYFMVTSIREHPEYREVIIAGLKEGAIYTDSSENDKLTWAIKCYADRPIKNLNKEETINAIKHHQRVWLESISKADLETISRDYELLLTELEPGFNRLH